MKKIVFYPDKKTILTIIIIATIAVYANTLTNGFVLDDEQYLIQSDFIKRWKNAFTIFTSSYLSVSAKNVDLNRPLMTLSLMWDYSIWDLNPIGYHLTNTLLHLLNTCFIFSLGILTFKGTKVPLIAALFFGLHPMHTEAVNGINFREDLLVTAFYLLSLITFIKAKIRNKPHLHYLISLAFFACALLSKEMAITLPFMLFLYLTTFAPKDNIGNMISSNKWFFVCSVVLISLYLLGLSTLYRYTDLPKAVFFGQEWYLVLPTAGRIIVQYIKLLIFPIELSIDHNPVESETLFDVSGLISIGFVITFFCLSIYYLRKNRLPLFFLLWFFITLLPVTATFYQQPVAERFLYLPSAGIAFIFAMMLAWLYKRLKRFKPAFLVSLSFLMLFYAVGIVNRNTAWRDGYHLWKDAIRKVPDSQRGHFNMGWELLKKGLSAEALTEFKASLTTGSNRIIAIEPVESFMGIGLAYQGMGQHLMSVSAFEEAKKANPSDSRVYYFLGVSYQSMGMHKEAVDSFIKAINLRHDFTAARMELGNLYVILGYNNKAVEEYKAIIQIEPDSHRGRMAAKLMMEAME